MDSRKREELINKIEIVFGKTPYPGDDNIGIGFPDGEEVSDAFNGKHWKELSLDLLFYHRDKLPFLKPDAFRFYLPAYLRSILVNFEKMDTLRENLPFNLAPVSGSRLIENAKVMTSDEKTLILEYLKNYEDMFPEGFYNDTISEDVKKGIQFWITQSSS